MRYTISCQTQYRANDFLVIPKTQATVPLIEQMLGQIQVTSFDRKKGPINKVGRINVVGDDDAEMADKVISESIYSTISWSRSRIQLIQNGFRLIRFNDN